MKFHAVYFRWTPQHDFVCIVGCAGGRVPYEPLAKWLYSFRLYFICAHLEILWTTGNTKSQ